MAPVHVLLLLACAIVARAATPTAVFNVTGGAIQGVYSPDGSVAMFKGVPYATPPVGSLRFMPPQPAPGWTGVLQTTQFSAGCMQQCDLPQPAFTCPPTTSEDCLYLNVYAPETALNGSAPSLLPVFVFIHGGAFIVGAAGTPLYRGEELAKTQNVVVVTMNYRLGPFGSLFTGLEPGDAQGNQMLQDQRLAMQWTVANIGNFGGDATQITLGGESAGGISVGCHLVSPLSRGLFKAAYMSSNPYGLPLQDVDLATKLGHGVGFATGCDGASSGSGPGLVSCLQGIDATTLLIATNSTRNFPWPDDFLAALLPWTAVVIPGSQELPIEPFKASSQVNLTANVPILFGNNANDSVLFVNEMFSKPITMTEVDILLGVIWGIGNAIKIRLMYGDSATSDARLHLSRITTDYLFYCPARAVARQWAASNGNTVYRYIFSQLPSYSTWMWNPAAPMCETEICHADDLPFVFGDLTLPNQYSPTPTAAEEQLVRYMQNALGTFIWSGAVGSTMGWAPYSTAQDNVNELIAPTPAMAWGVRSGYCDLWDEIGYTSR